jgi:hypothetical protein
MKPHGSPATTCSKRYTTDDLSLERPGTVST